jgi:hypothetical protein
VPGLRFVYLLALVVWLGGLIVLAGIAAPAVFDVLQSRVPTDGRVLAGAVFGAILSRFFLVSFVCGALMASTLIGMALIGPRPRPYAPRLAVIGFMLGVTALVAYPITWQLEALQAAVSGSIDSLPTGDSRRASFERTHGLSSLLLSLEIVGGLTLLFWDVRERRR